MTVPHTAQDVAHEIQALYEAWFAAIAARDRGWFERVLADDLRVRSVPRNQERGKAEMIEFELTIPPLRVQTLSVVAHAYDNIALSHWSALVWRADDGPQVAPTHALFSSAWRRKGDSWEVFDHIRAGEVPPA